MADIKITDLAAYTDPVSTDVVPIVDVGNDLTKKVSIADLLENAGTGTAAAPSFSFDGDNDTGIYQPGVNQIAIATGGTQRLVVNSSGAATFASSITAGGGVTTSNLAVDTNSDTDGQVAAAFYGATGGAVRGLEVKLGNINSIANALVTLDAKQSAGGALALAARGTEVMRIGISQVSIGGTLPSSPNIELNADGSATFAGTMGVGYTSTPDDNFSVTSSASRTTLSINADSGQDTRLSFKRSNTYRFNFVNDSTDNFSIQNSSFSSIISFNASGNVGIGGTLPSSPNIELNANGSAEFAGDITCTNNSKGLILKSPDGTSFRLSVANDGTLSASAA